ncbi:hypothetical protein [Salipiger sp.]|uniref:hypothetical protein n=1 Tax=Salipiger sp. TaxID=2078585 RepID=UPI003A987158
MTQETIATFVLCFAAGPAIYVGLMRLRPGVVPLTGLAMIAMTAMAGAIGLRILGGALPSLGMLWLSWILVLALGALALRRRVRGRQLARWVTLAGLLATTAPWFGLATAQLLSS